MKKIAAALLSLASLLGWIGCSSDGGTGTGSADGGAVADASGFPSGPTDGGKPRVDGGFATPDGGVLPAERFATKVVDFKPGQCAGFGIPAMPEVVLGPPVGAGDRSGGLDVVSLGEHGSIVLSFEPNAIVDGPGADFIVFENAFFAGGDPESPFAEPGEVSVSDDGVTWKTFSCTATAAPYGACAGWHPVYSAPDNGVSPFDPAVAGGDAFDLAQIGVTHARYVRIVDKSPTSCPVASKPTNFGFDLDAVSIVHGEK
jgi:hypothetical protein